MPTLPNAALWRDAEKPSAGRWYQRAAEIRAVTEQGAPGPRVGLLIATIEPGIHALADARLIAAAKELREALDLARLVLDRVDAAQMIPGPLADDVRLASRLAIHALAKSEGR